ncbi:Crp/Fnr family transcriptional regulator [Dysosmobacter sp.]|jgi:CRP/FNR family transcriptional regulator|uniref:Crp/Fnr family transcriptional regulator n=2 Tax=Dysosmobacter sp. TaxID=2591382 RepID=UPI001BB47212|nr:Crp/Fnr family transcriptional regulator [Dysosmobacter sp.]MCI6054631.1 Crp/Fnr family transcriptional regulator [Dysosmobacter sp.]MDY5510080.1 Crp/Fnr family transcriptional regulator [Dysosmobacter sp.]QUO37836.1 Crp/Fnr family transcriptional regulator [Dysosmobacter sp. Marseille-Q4140]
MELSGGFPIWDKLTAQQRETLTAAAAVRFAKRGTLLHGGSGDCLGLLVVREGQLRAYILSEEGREITLYRLFQRDICLFSAACAMGSLQLDIALEAEKDTEFFLIPPEVYRSVMEASAPLANYTNTLMAERFSQVMWLMEQVMWHSFDRRLAAFLLEESALEGSARLELTHERIAAHLGTAREVVTRMLRYFQSEGLVRLSRGAVELTDTAGLRRLSA